MEQRKGIPRKDGSGRGIGANAGRGGCEFPQRTRKGIGQVDPYAQLVGNIVGNDYAKIKEE